MHMQSPWETNVKTPHQQDLTKPRLTSKQGLNVSHIPHTDFFPMVTDEKSTFADGDSPNTITRGQRKQQILCCRGYCYLDRLYSRKKWRALPYKSLAFFCKHAYQLHFFSHLLKLIAGKIIFDNCIYSPLVFDIAINWMTML